MPLKKHVPTASVENATVQIKSIDFGLVKWQRESGKYEAEQMRRQRQNKEEMLRQTLCEEESNEREEESGAGSTRTHVFPLTHTHSTGKQHWGETGTC